MLIQPRTVMLSLRVLVVVGALLGVLLATSPAGAAGAAGNDRDGDGLRNAFEINQSETKPGDADSDDDGIRDGRENPDHDRLNNLGEEASATDPQLDDSDDDGLVDGLDDEDCDGITNHDEVQAGTDPQDVDTDEDGIDDGQENDVDDGEVTETDPSCDDGEVGDDDAD